MPNVADQLSTLAAQSPRSAWAFGVRCQHDAAVSAFYLRWRGHVLRRNADDPG